MNTASGANAARTNAARTNAACSQTSFHDPLWGAAFFAPIARILDIANPIQTPPWRDADGLSIDLVNAAIQRRERASSVEVVGEARTGAKGHAERIAKLFMTSWADPIVIDFGVPSMGRHPTWAIWDGNHRLYAAALRGDRAILSTIDGSIAAAEMALGISIGSLFD